MTFFRKYDKNNMSNNQNHSIFGDLTVRQRLGGGEDNPPAYPDLTPTGHSTPRTSTARPTTTRPRPNQLEQSLNTTVKRFDEPWIEKQHLRSRYGYFNLIVIFCTLLAVSNGVMLKLLIEDRAKLTEINSKLDFLEKINVLDPKKIMTKFDDGRKSTESFYADKMNDMQEEIISVFRSNSHKATKKISDMGEKCVLENVEIKEKFTLMGKEFQGLKDSTVVHVKCSASGEVEN